MDANAVKAMKFAEATMNFVLLDHNLPRLSNIHYSKNAPTVPFDRSVGILVVALIKGCLRRRLIQTGPHLMEFIDTGEKFAKFIIELAVLFFQDHGFTYRNMFKVVGIIIMISIWYCYHHGATDALKCACQVIAYILKDKILENQVCVQRGGLSDLINFAIYFTETQEVHIMRTYLQERYPW